MPNTNTDVIGRVQHLLGWSRATLCLVVLLALGFSTVSFAAVPTITLEQGTLSGVEIGEVTAFSAFATQWHPSAIYDGGHRSRWVGAVSL